MGLSNYIIGRFAGARVDTALRADDIRTSSRAMIYSLFEKADDIHRVAVDDMQGFRLDWVRKRGTEHIYSIPHNTPFGTFGLPKVHLRP